MADETLVEALERVDVGCGHDCRVAIADHAATLLPILVAHATAAERAALLRMLLGEAQAAAQNEYAADVWNRAIHLLPSNLLAPEAR